MEKFDLQKAHSYSANHRPELSKDAVCGCFYCLAIFHPTEIRDWLPEGRGTAICPRCGVDAVIGESSGFPITPVFLREMRKKWFG